ncbi:MAG: DUF433 domain-containing protein [Acidobacteria bacterium]|nr:DUF433 domain-containing protein [Acidobacteriota bacterium]
MLANGDSVEDLLAESPSLSREDILACLDYAVELAKSRSPRFRPPAPDRRNRSARSAGFFNNSRGTFRLSPR